MSVSPKVLSCSSCAGPATYGAPACRWCGSPLHWAGVPELVVGEVLHDVDLRTDPLPDPVSEPRQVRHESGVQIGVDGRQMCSGYWDHAIASASVTLVGAALDRHGSLGVLARRAQTGSFRCAYALTVRPGYRTWSLSALLWDEDGRTMAHHLRNPTFAAPIRGVGDWNAVELRTADSLLEVRVNDEVIETVIDGVFGYGMPGWRVVATTDAPAELVLHRFTVRALK